MFVRNSLDYYWSNLEVDFDKQSDITIDDLCPFIEKVTLRFDKIATFLSFLKIIKIDFT